MSRRSKRGQSQPDKDNASKPEGFGRTAGDYVITALKASASMALTSASVVSGLPPEVGGYVGGSLVELFDLITTPVEKRRDAFMLALAKDVQQLREEGVDVERLFADEAFASTLLHTIQVVLRTHQQEKLQALHNAIKNSARPNAPNADLRLMFLNFVDTFTPWHLRALQYYTEEREHGVPIRRLGREVEEPVLPLLAAGFAELGGQEDFANQVALDLVNRRLLSVTPSPSGMHMASASRLYVTVTTEFGRRFLDFISFAEPAVERVKRD